MEKEIRKFLFELMQTYSVYGDSDKKNIINNTSKYISENLSGKKVDFEKAKNLLFEKYERKSFPTPQELMKFLNKALITEPNPEPDDGTWYLLTLSDGTKYSFVPAPFGKTFDELNQEFEERYDNFTFEKHDDNTILIGNKLIRLLLTQR